ncbi:DEAD/DEAH box helicase [Candidatus Poribacteria bacterium]|nr:DEAD/DEAH box helicase [Candidatus Poribacteria bacterium]MYK17004.1 DEAD/DEAH box helicase [Candidatus Poribacteria bacterium]
MLYKGLQLDRFQEEAIEAIDRDASVIVTAPTGAGKTVIAEYAVEKCIEENRRVIYTAPIKALSNQKYRDFYAEYGDKIGIVTGDVVLNPYAQVLLMTTEIFRNTIFDDIERLQDVSYVIFDEIHYINDTERGTVWEESLIFAPQHIKFVCLSATIPNIDSFTEWMQSVRDIDIEMVEELNRPVPLEHHLYFQDYGIGNLKHIPHIRSMAQRKARKRKYDADDEPTPALPSDFIETRLIPHLRREKQLPCLYFCFSRKGCEENANALVYGSHLQLLNKRQQTQILEQFDALCVQFDIVDEKKINDFRRLISRGIAYHHAGMLPTLKEVVERLFTSGLIQLLFTTETFAVGINMPACTVVFDSLEKYDGIGFRHLKAREYHQMAGRAGRRGIDTIGYVYSQIIPAYADSKEIRDVIANKIEPIESQFNLSYSSILNLYQKYGDDIYDVYTMSLSNHQNYVRVAELNAQIKANTQKLQTLPEPECIHEGIDGSTQIEHYNRLNREREKNLQRLYAERSQIKSQTRGKKRKKERVKRLNVVQRKIQRFQTKSERSLCDECQHLSTCSGRDKAIRREENRIQKLKKRTTRIENSPREQIAARLRVLEELGYVEAQTLLPRGRTAAHIYGYELQLTQLLFGGFFERLTEDEINCLMVAIISEPRKDGYFKPLKDERLLEILYTVSNEISLIQYLEVEHEVTETTPFLELRLCTAMLAWSRGCDFDKLERYARVDPGDFVRTFRLVIDQLRQIRRAMSQHTALVEKLNRCIEKINRDVVDAERQLRIGQENLDDAARKDVVATEIPLPTNAEHTDGVVIENETPRS